MLFRNAKRSAAKVAVVAFSACFPAALAHGAQMDVAAFGQHGWGPDDMRNASGTNIKNGYTNAPLASATVDTPGINAQAAFVAGPVGSTYGGAVAIDGTTSNNGKTNISVIDTGAGFAAASTLPTPAFSAQWEWYGLPNPTSRTLAFKIGIQSADWANSQASFSAIRSGEAAWDLVLVHIPSASNNVWSTVSVDEDTGGWNLFRQAGNAYFPVPTANPDPNAPTITLDDWANDATWGPLLFGEGAKITSLQFGLGSGQRDSISYLDYMQTNLLNGGDVVNFIVPEPGSVSLLGAGGLMLLRRRRVA